MNEFIPHIILGIFATNLPIIQTLLAYWILIFVLNRDAVQQRINLPSFAAKDTSTQTHHFLGFILGRLFGTLLHKFIKA